MRVGKFSTRNDIQVDLRVGHEARKTELRRVVFVVRSVLDLVAAWDARPLKRRSVEEEQWRPSHARRTGCRKLARTRRTPRVTRSADVNTAVVERAWAHLAACATEDCWRPAAAHQHFAVRRVALSRSGAVLARHANLKRAVETSDGWGWCRRGRARCRGPRAVVTQDL